MFLQKTVASCYVISAKLNPWGQKNRRTGTEKPHNLWVFGNGEKPMIMTASELRAQAWREHIRNHLSSSMSVRSWCRGNGISEKNFYHWRKKLSDRIVQTASANMECGGVPVIRDAWLCCDSVFYVETCPSYF